MGCRHVAIPRPTTHEDPTPRRIGAAIGVNNRRTVVVEWGIFARSVCDRSYVAWSTKGYPTKRVRGTSFGMGFIAVAGTKR